MTMDLRNIPIATIEDTVGDARSAAYRVRWLGYRVQLAERRDYTGADVDVAVTGDARDAIDRVCNVRYCAWWI